MRAKFLFGLLGAVAACAGCTTAPTRGAGPTAARAGSAEREAEAPLEPAPAARGEPEPSPPAFAAGVALPEGPGRDLLVGSCLSCHDLSALPLFALFYTRDSWRTLVLTMQAHGADVDAAEIEALADYLAQHFGPEAQ